MKSGSSFALMSLPVVSMSEVYRSVSRTAAVLNSNVVFASRLAVFYMHGVDDACILYHVTSLLGNLSLYFVEPPLAEGTSCVPLIGPLAFFWGNCWALIIL